MVRRKRKRNSSCKRKSLPAGTLVGAGIVALMLAIYCMSRTKYGATVIRPETDKVVAEIIVEE